jgi:hypothetical protein
MGALILLLFACWWPSSAPSPSQPYVVEMGTYATSPKDTADAYGGSDSSTEAGDPRPEAPSPLGSARPEPGPGKPEAKADPGVGGDHAD